MRDEELSLIKYLLIAPGVILMNFAEKGKINIYLTKECQDIRVTGEKYQQGNRMLTSCSSPAVPPQFVLPEVRSNGTPSSSTAISCATIVTAPAIRERYTAVSSSSTTSTFTWNESSKFNNLLFSQFLNYSYNFYEILEALNRAQQSIK